MAEGWVTVDHLGKIGVSVSVFLVITLTATLVVRGRRMGKERTMERASSVFLFCLLVFTVFMLPLFSITGYAEEAVPPAGPEPSRRFLAIPYPFFNDTIGAGVGAVIITEGYIQPQVLTVTSVLGSVDGTYLGFFMMRNYQVPWFRRVILEPQGSVGKFSDIKSYLRGNPAFPNERPGSNESSEDNFLESDGDDFWVELTTKYLLPIGQGKKSVFPRLVLENGIYVSGDTGGDTWNPFTSGRTYIEVTPFFRKQSLDDETGTLQKTAGIEMALRYDNTDYRGNPTKGSYQRVSVNRDWGALDSTAPYTSVGGEVAKFFSLGPSKHARQRTFAFNIWTSYCPTWDSSHTENGETVFHRPPTYRGANLGGLFRLRGFPATRFYDQAAIYYGLEYRHTLRWNPLAERTWNGRLDVDWFQVVAFGETGRVAPEWNLSTLHEDMKWSAGAGIRSMVNHVVIRVDLAASSEDVIAQLFIGHPF
ncbi:MAG: BamA/TamA family outer membrane protein [Deltaproteobacteria bacterium]|nr:BamA/TamA family outer membrane protein [Deltaproteobacteria bacterium]